MKRIDDPINPIEDVQPLLFESSYARVGGGERSNQGLVIPRALPG